MTSLKFPNMFNSGVVTVATDSHEATKQNLHLLLSSERGEFLYDPDFGIKLKAYLFDQNNYILRDILVDEIYNKLAIFMPQLIVDRRDIKIVQNGDEQSKLYCNIKALNKLDFTTDMYSLVLFEEKE